MEFCDQLSAFQGVIISADNIHSFSKLTLRGGNEDKIKNIISIISKFLESGKYSSEGRLTEESLDKARKFALFLILNSDLSVLSDMIDMEKVEPFLSTVPTIPKCLMCEMFWRLNFDRFVYEAIAFCDVDLATEIASAFIENIKYYTPSNSLAKIFKIITALYKLICRIHFFNFYNSILSDKLQIIFNHFQKAINYFTEPPKKENLNSLNKDELYKYLAERLNTMLFVLLECFTEFTSPQELENISCPIYTLTYMGSVTKNLSITPCECPSQEIADCLNKCHATVLDKCQELLMGVTVDIFCAWSEFEENGVSTQQLVGELCYKVRTKLLSIQSVAEHSAIDMMQHISFKPLDINDIVENSEVNIIVENIDKSEDKAAWLKALDGKEKLYLDETLLKCVANTLHVLTDHECYNMYKSLKKFISSHPDKKESLDLFTVKLFVHCNMSARYEILRELFSNKCLVDMKESEEFETKLTETFNKIILAPDANKIDVTDILSLFMQNPKKIFSKIFDLAAENTQQTNVMMQVMLCIKEFAKHYYNSDTIPCIVREAINAFENLDTEVRKHNYISFLCALKKNKILSGVELFLLIIMPKTHKALLTKDIISLNLHCKLLEDAYVLEELLPYRAPLLAVLGQVLETVRWSIKSYSALAPSTLDQALTLQMKLYETYDTGIPDKELNWLRGRMRSLRPQNLYYYRKIWNISADNMIEFVGGIKVTGDIDMEELVGWLSQVICTSTQTEWCHLWECIERVVPSGALEVFHTALSMVTVVEKDIHTPVTWGCIANAYRMFYSTIAKKCIQGPVDERFLSRFLARLFETMNLIDGDEQADIVSAVLPIFGSLVVNKGRFNMNIEQILSDKLKRTRHTELLFMAVKNGHADGSEADASELTNGNFEHVPS